MTACAMTVGMVPMALALEKRQPDAGAAGPGGDRRTGDVHLCHLAGAAVDLRHRDRPQVAHSPSIYPDDPDSAYYDPSAYRVDAIDHKAKAGARRPSLAPKNQGSQPAFRQRSTITQRIPCIPETRATVSRAMSAEHLVPRLSMRSSRAKRCWHSYRSGGFLCAGS